MNLVDSALLPIGYPGDFTSSDILHTHRDYLGVRLVHGFLWTAGAWTNAWQWKARHSNQAIDTATSFDGIWRYLLLKKILPVKFDLVAIQCSVLQGPQFFNRAVVVSAKGGSQGYQPADSSHCAIKKEFEYDKFFWGIQSPLNVGSVHRNAIGHVDENLTHAFSCRA